MDTDSRQGEHTTPPEHVSLPGRLRIGLASVAATGKDAARVMAKRAEQIKIRYVNLPRAYARLGKHVYAERDHLHETHGKDVGINELIGEIERLLARCDVLSGEIEAISKETLHTRRKPAALIAVLVACALLFTCFGGTGILRYSTTRPESQVTLEKPSDGQTKEPTVKPQSKKPPIKVDGLTLLHQEYWNNPVAFDLKYKGRRVLVPMESSQDAIVMTQQGDSYWLLKSIGQRSLRDARDVYGVECKLSPEGEKQFANRAKVPINTDFVGTVVGTRDYPENIFSGRIVTLEDCFWLK